MQQKSSNVYLPRLERVREARLWSWSKLAGELDLSVSMLMSVKAGKRGFSEKAKWRLLQLEADSGVMPLPDEQAKVATEMAEKSASSPEERKAIRETTLDEWRAWHLGVTARVLQQYQAGGKPEEGPVLEVRDHDIPEAAYDPSPTAEELARQIYHRSKETYEMIRVQMAAVLHRLKSRRKETKK